MEDYTDIDVNVKMIIIRCIRKDDVLVLQKMFDSIKVSSDR